MKKQKNHFNFDSFMHKLDSALLAAQKTAVLAEKSNNSILVKAARKSIADLRAARSSIDAPLVWFKMEKGATYKHCEDGVWRVENRLPRKRPEM